MRVLFSILYCTIFIEALDGIYMYKTQHRMIYFQILLFLVQKKKGKICKTLWCLSTSIVCKDKSRGERERDRDSFIYTYLIAWH